MNHDTSVYKKNCLELKAIRDANKKRHNKTRQKMKHEIACSEKLALFRLVRFGLNKGIPADDLKKAIENCINNGHG